jgi:hypothetical protein
MSRTSVITTFAAATLAAALAGPAGAGSYRSTEAVLRNLNAQPQSVACHTIDEFDGDLFPMQEVVGYDFTGADASSLKRAMDELIEEAAPEASLIRIVLVHTADEALAFQFGADGCYTTMLDLGFEEMGGVFVDAGVPAPFGPTFYQLTGRSI